MKTALITGGNGGLGRALAAGLQARDWHTVLMDIDVTGLAASHAQSPVQVDLTDATALKNAIAHLIAQHPSIDLVIYNAGVTQVSPFDALAEETHRKIMEINYFSAVNLASAALGALRASRGTHLAISSVAGFSPLYHRTAYAASKHALQGFFASLRSEEAAHGVRVAIAAPSFVATNPGNDVPNDDGLQRPGAAADGLDYMTPADAAAEILKGLDRGANFIPVGRIARAAWWVHSLSPRLFEHLMMRRIRGRDGPG